MLHWMSFADGKRPKNDQFLGVILIDGTDVVDVTVKTHKLRINPGGEICCAAIPKDQEYAIPESFRNRLLNRSEVDRLVAHMRTKTSVVMNTD
jgi:hypothetical protein